MLILDPLRKRQAASLASGDAASLKATSTFSIVNASQRPPEAFQHRLGHPGLGARDHHGSALLMLLHPHFRRCPGAPLFGRRSSTESTPPSWRKCCCARSAASRWSALLAPYHLKFTIIQQALKTYHLRSFVTLTLNSALVAKSWTCRAKRSQAWLTCSARSRGPRHLPAGRPGWLHRTSARWPRPRRQPGPSPTSRQVPY